MAVNASRPFTPSNDLMQSSPSTIFTFFLFHRWDVYLDAMMTPDKIDIDSTTASLLSTCVDEDQRNKFWKQYMDKKEELNKTGKFNPGAAAITASILTSGAFFAWVAEACEFVEKSTGASL
jgi:hypothetical protein